MWVVLFLFVWILLVYCWLCSIRLMLTSFVTFYFVSMVVLGLVSCAFDVLVYGCDVMVVGGWW